MVRYGQPQLRDALIGQGCQELFAVIQHDLPLKPGPDREGEMLRAVGGQVQQIFLLGLVRFWGLDSLGLGMVEDSLHKIAHLLLGTDVAFRQKLVVGSLHGDFADFQILGQGPFGGQLFTGLQNAGENIRPDAAVKGLVEGHTRGLF